MNTTRPARPRRLIRSLLASLGVGAVAGTLLTVATPAQALPMTGIYESYRVSSGYCAVWRSSGISWDYVGIRSC